MGGLNTVLDSTKSNIAEDKTDRFDKYKSRQIVVVEDDDVPRPKPLDQIDTARLKSLVRWTEKWRGFMFNLAYELNQMKKMLVKAEDATIKVRRLVHNFGERMKEVERQVWDKNHQLKPGFSFAGMSTASLREIILLHDWYACNAPEKTFEDMGFKDNDEFMDFRKRCNKIAYNLRKNQYAQLLAVKKERLQNRISQLEDLLRDSNKLQWKDKYGWEAKKEEEKEWSIDNVTDEAKKRIEDLAFAEDRANPEKKLDKTLQDELSGKVVRVFGASLGEWNPSDGSKAAAARTSPFAVMERILKKDEMDGRQYEKDLAALERRTLDYFKAIGLIDSDSDIEKLATRNKASNYTGNISDEMKKLENAKERLDKAKETMNRQRAALQSIIDSVYSAESKVQEL